MDAQDRGERQAARSSATRRTIMKLDVVAENDVPFRVVYLPADVPSENYPDRSRIVGMDRPRVEFYDRRYDHTPDGQFTGGSYFLADILAAFGAVSLSGDIPAWTIDAATMRLIQTWLHNVRGPWR